MSQWPNVFATDEKIGSLLDQSITRHFMSTVTDQNGKYIAEYVWIGGTGADMRSKGRTFPMSKFPKSPDVRPPCLSFLPFHALTFHKNKHPGSPCLEL